MGNSFPTDTKTPTVLNFILREMFARADLVDIYSLADPNRCGKYIVVAADALETLFAKVRLDPSATKEGTLYFQSIDGLTKGTSLAAKDARDKQKLYCKQIAFFFVRIFQVFAALTLTILDSELPAVDPSDTLPKEVAPSKRATFIDPRSFLGKQRGGYLVAPFIIGPQSGAYQILNDYLNSQGLRDINDTRPLKFTDKINLLIRHDTVFKNEIDGLGNKVSFDESDMKPLLIYAFKRGSEDYYLTALLQLVNAKDENNFTSKINTFKLYDNRNQFREDIPLKEIVGTFESNPLGGQPIYKDGQGIDIRKLSGSLIFPAFLVAAFETAVVQKFGREEPDLFALFQSWGLLRPATSETYNIAGTKFYVSNKSRKGKVLNLSYINDSVKLPGESGPVKVRINDIGFGLSGQIAESGDGRTLTYPLVFNFSRVTISRPEGYDRTDIGFPDEPNAKKFTLTRDSYSYTKEPRDAYNKSLSTWMQDKMERILLNKDDDVPDGTGIKYTREGLPIPHDAEGIPEQFRVKALWKALAKDPPVKSHCIARATQLLSVAAIRGTIDDTAFTQACRTTFLYQKDGSLPTPGQGIFQKARDVTPDKAFQGEFGILALATLFVETLGADGMPKMADAAKYRTFLANLKFAFEKTKGVDLANPPKLLGEIRERLPGGVCERAPDSRMLLPRDLASSLQGVTKQLWSQQVAHVGKAMDLIFELFDRDSVINKRQFALNQRILAGGTPAVNTVAAKALDLLLKYYTDCEMTYRQGLSMIVAADAKKPLQPIPST